MSARKTILLAVLVGLLQIGFLGWMIAGRAAILRDGREVLLKVQPIDPRDFLRGDYVRLGYEISSVPLSVVTDAPKENVYSSTEKLIFVRLAKQADGLWTVKSAHLGSPSGEALGADEVDLRGTTYFSDWAGDPSNTVFVDYGIERYYVPEGEGLEIEKNMVTRPFSILAAVADDGTPQIKGLLDDGVMLYQEPMY